MPAFKYNCENFPNCPGMVASRGDKCGERQERERRANPTGWQATGWERSDNRKDAQQGHKKGKNK